MPGIKKKQDIGPIGHIASVRTCPVEESGAQLVREIIQTKQNKIKQHAHSKPSQSGSSPVYDQLREDLGLNQDFPTLGENLFNDLDERIAHEFNVTDYWVCGGALMSEKWLRGNQPQCTTFTSMESFHNGEKTAGPKVWSWPQR